MTTKTTKSGEHQVTTTTTYPYSSVVKLIMVYGEYGAACSGAFIHNTHTIFTAGHCVYSHDKGGLPDHIYVFPAQAGWEDYPFGYKEAYNYATNSAWSDYEDYTQDWGVILVDPFAQNTTYNMGITYTTDTDWYWQNQFTTSGYPGQSPYNGEEMWTATGDVIDISYGRMMQLDYEFDDDPYLCIPGQSGSPIYYDEGSNNFSITAVLTLASCHSVMINSTINNFIQSFDCDGCLVDGDCISDGTVNSDNICEVCDQSESSWGWSNNDNGDCDDGEYCNGAEFCHNGDCRSPGSPCEDGESCDESADSCFADDDDDDDDDDNNTADDDDDDSDTSCSEIIARLYNDCDLKLIRSDSVLTGDEAYDACKASDGPWECAAECLVHPNVSSCEDFASCLESACGMGTSTGTSSGDDDDDDSSGGGCGI